MLVKKNLRKSHIFMLRRLIMHTISYKNSDDLF